ncbi:MAG: hypothetical protein JXA71_03370 [Chitinispirillaceae bacterium]|nr:hypothetical protein [Chitinispirillaceae bacterium]
MASNASRFLNTQIVLFLWLCISQPVNARQTSDTIDSSSVYREIETFSKKSKLTAFMHSLVFKPVASTPAKKGNPRLLRRRYEAFEGKIIRSINIVTLDPFGYSVKDTTILPQNYLFKTGNVLHLKTHNSAIGNLLLIHKKQPFDSLLVKESERLIRRQHYIDDVLLFISPAGKTDDSVDMYIRVSDKWSIIPDGTGSAARLTAGFTENNFTGFGHELKAGYTWNHSNGKNAFVGNYSVPNIRNSHVQSVLHYAIDENDNSGTSGAVERPFYSPLARWAAGLNISRQFLADTSADTMSGRRGQDIKFTTQDYWAGTANRISKGTAEIERTTNAIFSSRYLRIRYLEKPDEAHDSLRRYPDEDFLLTGLGISTRRYFQDNYIFNFGIIEDVPVGKVYGLTGGYQIRNNTGRLYLGARISSGNYNEWGYLSSTVEYGTFFRESVTEQGVFDADAHYFSNMFEIGNWRIRQFIKPQVTWGINRYSYDSLTINDKNGIRGFNSSLRGTRKVLLTLQTQSFTPWKVLGFRFGPFLVGSVAMLGDATSGFKNSPVYSQLGTGALINNNYLVLSNFQLSVAYYPSIPGKGYNVIKINVFRTSDFGFRDFTFGKPEIVAFR